MRKSRFTETLIIGIIKKQKAGMPTAEVCQRNGLSPASNKQRRSKKHHCSKGSHNLALQLPLFIVNRAPAQDRACTEPQNIRTKSAPPAT